MKCRGTPKHYLAPRNRENCTYLFLGHAKSCIVGHLFTGKERDAETGNDYFGARYYSSASGRFISPDWDAKPATVPYASFGDPQTLNLYTYVENGPLNRVDAQGHAAQPSGTAENAWPGYTDSCPVDIYCLIQAWKDDSGDSYNVDQAGAQAAESANDAAEQASNGTAQAQSKDAAQQQQQNTPSAPNPPASTPTPNPAPPSAAYVPGLPNAANPKAQADGAAVKNPGPPTPAPVPRPVPGPDPVPPQVPAGEPGPPPPGLTGRTLGWIILQIVKGIGSKGSDFILCVTCQQQQQVIQTQHDMYCGKNNPNCSAELLQEEWPIDSLPKRRIHA